MANKFDGLLNLGKWRVINSESFTEEELNLVESNEVMEMEYGKAVCLYMKDGQVHRLMLSINSQNIPVGTSINLATAKYLTLSKPGSGTINRVEV